MPVDGAARFVSFETQDVRFPTSAELDGSDAMNPDPDYSAAYVIVRTDASDGVEGHGFAFTIGRGNDIQVAAIEALAPLLLDRPVSEVLSDMGAFSRTLTGDSQLRWLGPDKGVGHMAAGAVLNAVWDLYAKREGKPLWKLLSDLEPEEIVDLVDFRYIADALTPEDALALLRRAAPTRAEREELLLRAGVPAYATSPGWLGYSDDRLRERCRAAVEAGFDTVKLKVGRDIEEDVRRIKIAREVLGPDVRLMVDANQRWGVQEAIASIQRLAPFDLLWVEEPTHPDDVLGHAAIARAVAPVRLATGEHVANRIVFKQLLQAGAIGFCQIDAARVAGVNENIAILLLAAKHGVPVCPHAGGVGLCELVQHLAMFDFVAVGGHHNERVVEYVDHLHEHFIDPVVVVGGRYRAPTAPGFSSTMLPESLAAHRYPDGAAWSSSAEGAPRSAEPTLGWTQR